VAPNRVYKPGGPNQVLGWEYQKSFYELMRKEGLHGEAAQGFQAFAHGMSRITTTGYNEGDFAALSMRDQIFVNRKAAYKFTCLYRPEQAAASIPVAPWSENEDAPSLMPMEAHSEEYDAYLANTYGYGFEGQLFCKVAYEGPKSKKAICRWLDFWKTHSRFFKNGYLIHVREPDGKRLDAVMHILDDGSRRALVVVYNPAESEQSDMLTLPFDRIGWAVSGWHSISENGVEGRVVDGQLPVTVPAFNATWLELSERKE